MWLFLRYGFKVKRSGELRTPIVFMHFFKIYDKNKTRTIFVAFACIVTGITTFDVYATKLLGKITSLYVDGIFSSIVLLTYRRR